MVAEVSVSGTREVAINQGFRLLANYIFGANTTNSKIAMTAPVTQVQSGNEWRVRFSGLAGEADIQTRTEALNGYITTELLITKSAPILARYNLPWTLWFMWRNEVMIKVD